MESRLRNAPGRNRGDNFKRPQRIPRQIRGNLPRNNRRIIPRRNLHERFRNNRNNRNIGRFRRFNNLNRRPINIPRRRIFVGRLPLKVNDDVLHRLFRIEGNIISARVIKDFNGRSKGFGFVEFQNPRDAWKCIQKWNNTYLDGQIIKVHYPFRIRRFNNNRNNGRFGPRGPRGRFRALGRQMNRVRRF